MTEIGIIPYLLSMPETTGNSGRGHAWPLSKAEEVGQLVRIRSLYCRITRHYRPADLVQLLGDTGIDHVPSKMRCEQCGRRDYLDAIFFHPTAIERETLKIRRLLTVKIVRKVIWRDG